MNRRNLQQLCLICLVIASITGCAGNYSDTMHSVQRAVQVGDYQRADELLSKEKDFAEGKDRLLYFLDKGLIAHLNGAYNDSNWFFEQAVQRMEELDYVSVSGTAAKWLISDLGQPYRGEDFERVMVHYYMALNYLMVGEPEEALVECRRLNTVLQELNNRYEHKNVYKTDAFVLYLSGLIYEALGEVNDALIDYRKAYDTYVADYGPAYGTAAPLQLLDNLLRTASALGFSDVVDTYSKVGQGASRSAPSTDRDSARLVVIWNNGFIPYKKQHIYRDYLSMGEKKEEGCYIKLAFPELVSRNPVYTHATVTVGETTASFELAEDLTQIAIKNLEDRRLRTIAQATVRNVLKCTAEHEFKEENQALGWLLALVTEATEQADTRSWLLLPADIRITELRVPPGVSEVELSFVTAGGQVVAAQKYTQLNLQKGQTTFLVHRTF